MRYTPLTYHRSPLCNRRQDTSLNYHRSACRKIGAAVLRKRVWERDIRRSSISRQECEDRWIPLSPAQTFVANIQPSHAALSIHLLLNTSILFVHKQTGKHHLFSSIHIPSIVRKLTRLPNSIASSQLCFYDTSQSLKQIQHPLIGHNSIDHGRLCQALHLWNRMFLIALPRFPSPIVLCSSSQLTNTRCLFFRWPSSHVTSICRMKEVSKKTRPRC